VSVPRIRGDDSNRCPLCNADARKYPISSLDGTGVDCERCGDFKVTREFLVNVGTATPREKALVPYLAAYIRRVNTQGITPLVGSSDWEERARAHTSTPVTRKLELLLSLLASRGEPGTGVPFDYRNDAPLVDASNERQVAYLLEECLRRGDVERTGDSFTDAGGVAHPKLRVTIDGWRRLEPGPGGVQGRCFVAMSFHPSLLVAYTDGIYPALKPDCQLDPIRLDREEHNDRIDDRIMVEIRRAQFTVADVTLQRPGVYFEAGFAMGLGRPVIWTCREDDFENVHFDTRQYNHVVWSDPADLRVKLATRVQATIPNVHL
jgi:hypothetical protein